MSKLRIVQFVIFLILITMVVFSCTSSEALPEGVYFTSIYSDSINLGGSPLLIPAYSEIYNTEILYVECAEANKWYLVSGNTTTGQILGFTDNGRGRLTYTDITPNRICLINTAVTVQIPVEDAPAIVSMQLWINGVPDTASLVADYLTVDDNADSLPIVCLLKLLNTGDYIEIYVRSDQNNTTVAVATMTLIATTVD